MAKVRDPDVMIDQCSQCGGTFLDKHELNVLATGMAGNIEYCSIDDRRYADKFPVRKCPNCQDTLMKQIALLCYTDIILDHCSQCDGFFFDQREIKEMNVELKELAESTHGEEFRGYRDGYLVRLDKLKDVVASGTAMGAVVPTAVTHLRISVYYVRPLNLGLRIYSEKWTDKFIKVLRLSRKQDIQTGDPDFDAAFIIQGSVGQQVKQFLSSTRLRQELLNLTKQKTKIFVNPGSIEALDYCIMYTEGPYIGKLPYSVEEDPAGIVGRLLDVAKLLENSR